MQEFPEIGILHRRKIEAEIIKPIYEILIRNYGNKAAKAVIEEAVAKAAIEAGKEFAAKQSLLLRIAMKSMTIMFIAVNMLKCIKKWD